MDCSAAGDSFDAEIPPRITSIQPQIGSFAGGTDLTVSGTGFGADAAAMSVDIAGVPCDVTHVQTGGVICRLHSRPEADAPTRPTPTAALGNRLGSYPAERGVRWQWANAIGSETSMLLPSFATPSDCAFGCGSGWPELAPSGTAMLVEVCNPPPPPPHPLPYPPLTLPFVLNASGLV